MSYPHKSLLIHVNIISMKQFMKKITPILLFLLPVFFFSISYYFITTSAEDIYQGAGSYSSNISFNPINRSLEAFDLNGRITDMYAWSIIGFYDYHFQFGIDLIFRIIDIIVAVGAVYLLTTLIAGRRLRLNISDGVLMNASFIMLVALRYGVVFVSGFSMIHNYVPLILILLLFSIPYLMMLNNKPPKNHCTLLMLGMLFLGIIFGMSSTITPLAFLVAAIVTFATQKKKKYKAKSWFFAGIIGLIIGFFISNLIGPGISSYTASSTYTTNLDYVSISDLLVDPIGSTSRLISHITYNTSYFIGPLLLIVIICLFLIKSPRTVLAKFLSRRIPQSDKNIIIAVSVFIVFHILAVSQINAPFRLLLPAYTAAIFIIGRFLFPLINKEKVSRIVVISISLLYIIAHSILTIRYYQKTSVVLDEIKNHQMQEICIDYDRVNIKSYPILNLSQEKMLQYWGRPQTIYNKAVTPCQLEE